MLNPKAISVSELYGVLDKDTRDWTDGLLSNIFRWGDAAAQPVGYPSGWLLWQLACWLVAWWLQHAVMRVHCPQKPFLSVAQL